MSAVFRLVGRVFPDYKPLTIAYSPKFKREPSAGNEPECVIEVSISEGTFQVTIEIERFTDRDAMALFQAGWDAAQNLANTAGFIDAVPYNTVVDFIEKPDGSIQPLALGDTYLRSLGSFTHKDMETIADMLIVDFAFGLAMSDLLSMLSKPHYAPISYGRVAESIALLVAPSDKPKTMWSKTRSELRVSEEYLRKLTDVSTDPRHGKRTPVSAAANRELSKMAWQLMNRYVHYRIGGANLPEQSFPELTT
jgi:hypothetical protein